MKDRPSQSPFTGSQWVDLVVLIALIWAQAILGLTWGRDRPVPMLLFGLVVFAMLVKVGRWLIPLARERWRRRR